MVQYEKQIDKLNKTNENTVDSLYCVIDSLNLEIDTLNKKLDIFDFQIDFKPLQNQFNSLLDAIIRVESRGNDSAHAIGEDAVGCLQIRRTMVDDVNRILKRKGVDIRYTYHDRWDRNKSIEMFNIFVNHYKLTTAEDIARCWNGGPRGADKDATVYYWNKVKSELEEINS